VEIFSATQTKKPINKKASANGIFRGVLIIVNKTFALQKMIKIAATSEYPV
jgi:hypothetical protein